MYLEVKNAVRPPKIMAPMVQPITISNAVVSRSTSTSSEISEIRSLPMLE